MAPVLGQIVLSIAPMLEPGARVGAAATAVDAEALASRARQVHSVLDRVAQKQRTTAVLDSTTGKIAGSGVRDLSADV